jgi:copper chaperone CopZ
MTRIEITVEGMHCQGCERAVSAALERLAGVRDAHADHLQGRVRVSFEPERVSEQILRERIEEAGFGAR